MVFTYGSLTVRALSTGQQLQQQQQTNTDMYCLSTAKATGHTLIETKEGWTYFYMSAKQGPAIRILPRELLACAAAAFAARNRTSMPA